MLIDIPKDVQQSLAVPDWGSPMQITSYISRLPGPPAAAQIMRVLEALEGAKKPVLYVGGEWVPTALATHLLPSLERLQCHCLGSGLHFRLAPLQCRIFVAA